MFVRAQGQAHLADGLEEGQAFDVADRAADLDDDDVVLRRDRAEGRLDLVGHVGDDLDGLAQVLALALLPDDGFVDACPPSSCAPAIVRVDVNRS